MVGRLDVHGPRKFMPTDSPVGMSTEIYGNYRQLRTAQILAECRYEIDKSPENEQAFGEAKSAFLEYVSGMSSANAGACSRQYLDNELPIVAKEAGVSVKQIRRYINLNGAFRDLDSAIGHTSLASDKKTLRPHWNSAKDRLDRFVAALDEPQKRVASTLYTHFSEKLV